MFVVAACLLERKVPVSGWRLYLCRAGGVRVYLRCAVKAVPMAIAAGAANLLAGVWAATVRLC